MKKLTTIIFVISLSLIFVNLLPNTVKAAASSWRIKGISIESKWNGDFDSGNFRTSIDNAANSGVNYVALVIPIYQSSLNSIDIQNGGDTPTDAALISAIKYIHSKGMHVMLKPHLNTFSGEWRAYINPSDRNGWFTNYSNMLVRLGQIGQANQVEDFCLGTELIDMSSSSVNGTNTQNWISLISKVRQAFSGKLTYSGNWGPSGFVDEKNNIQFWGSLDYIGLSAYFNLNTDNQVSSMQNAWANYNAADILPLSQKFNKPVVFTEIGYQSKPNSQREPWNYNLSGGPDMVTQQNAYEALFSFWGNQTFMQGVALWDWSSNPNAGGTGDNGYTPQNKPAQDTMKKWFGGQVSQNPPPSGSFTANGSNLSTNSGLTVIVPLTVSSSQAASNIIVDVEIYNSAGSRVLQKVFSGIVFSSGSSQTFSTQWTAGADGNYVVKVGVFSGDWSANYYWNNQVSTIAVGGASTPPPPPPPSGQTIEIWWPTNGVTVSGIQPFKALLTNADVSTYQMYWQVDGGGLVGMPTNNTDYPHKEFLVDLTNWTWRGNGPYAINFVTKNLSGQLITQKSINIFVSR